MKLLLLSAALAVSTVIGASDAYAQEGVRDIGSATGKCTTFSIGPTKSSCKGFMLMVFNNGRVSFNFGTPEGLVSLSGGRDSQMTAGTYSLEVDMIRIGGKDTPIRNYPSRGSCTMNMTDDAKYVHSVKCSATNGLERIVVNFRGDGSRFEHKSF
jgi:hypothetical protein